MSVVESESRLRALRRSLRWEALYVSAPPNIRYLTGFSGSAGHLLVTRDEATLITDGRYRTQARRQTSGIAVGISAGGLQDRSRRGRRGPRPQGTRL